MARRATFVAVLTAALAVAAPAASQDIGSEKARVDQRIAELRSEISAANAREGVLTSQLSAVGSELRAAEAAVADAQSHLETLEAELARERAKLERLTVRLQAQTRRLERLRREYGRAVSILEERVRVAYIEQRPDLLSFLVSAASFSDLVDSYEFLQRIGAQDRHIARDVESAKNRTARERRATIETRKLTAATVSAISDRRDEARRARDRLAGERNDLASVRALKRSALAETRETRGDYVSEVEALAAESARLAEQIRAAQARSSVSGVSSSGFVWPVDGPVTSGFGMRWGRMHEGIDIAVPSGTAVRAAASGTVIQAGWLGGYGLLVVIDHGNGLATAYGHNSSLLVEAGQQVSQGDTIALSGSTGHSTGPHVHFEVRVNGAAVDPLQYL